MAELTKAMSEIARDIVEDYLASDIEYCCVYERDDTAEFDSAEMKAIHGEAMRILGDVYEMFESSG
ncbi:hypothetical protein [Nocardia cyriacigeorgica]|uniref:hypothetical protein n=1 Tax=Nocardia cyriacigeorgica TaxID=135487 RepID=UPI0024544776|nr:hypothetical protein [Nocardia cyriacigeorgica]